ncbi:VWA domain-containing protein [Nannocystaceae bacterium ST9]
MSAALPLMLTACPSDSGDENAEEAEEGISTIGDTDNGDGDTTTTSAGDTFDGDTTETADTTDTTTGMNCGEVSIVPEYVPPNVMLVVDASGSMISNKWDHDLNVATPPVTRWNTLYTVVEVVMNNFAGAMNSGIQRFPSADACPNATPQSSNCYNAGACIVSDTPEVGIAPDNAVAILGAIPGADADNVAVVGGTPATAGFVSARDHLLGQPEGIPNYVLLITDGAANCVDGLPFPDFLETYDDNLQLEVGNALTNDMIPTFVVGIDILDALVGVGSDGSPEANAFVELNEVALAGGFPKNMGNDPDKFFNTTNQQELLDAIQSILGEVTDCTIDLTMTPEGPPDPSQIPFVTFESNGMDVPFVEDCDTEDGWTWIVEGEIMTFCGSYCDNFKNGTAMFDGTYGCPPPE